MDDKPRPMSDIPGIIINWGLFPYPLVRTVNYETEETLVEEEVSISYFSSFS